MAKKTFWLITIIIGLIWLVHNLHAYPVDAGYDAWLHMRYANIISHQWRLPDLAETREGYNPPLFYLISGLIVKLISTLTHQDFFTAFKTWQYLSLIFSAGFLFLWWQIIKTLQPKNKMISSVFLFLLFSLPVFHKTIVMYNLELFSSFTITLALWYFILYFQPQPTLKKTLILSFLAVIALLTRMSSFVLVLILAIGLLSLGLIKQLSWQKTLKLLFVFFLTIFISTSWFYLGRANQDIYGVGEGGEPNQPFFQRQSLAFYTEIPFTLMMNYPIRFAKQTPLNRLIPIFYSEFWGDWWNYYSQTRFGLKMTDIRQDRYLTNPARVASLALQNRVNLFPSILLLISFGYLIVTTLKKSASLSKRQRLIHFLFIGLTVFTVFGWLYMLTKYPSWKGDSIKASYMLYIIPVFIYALILFLFKVLKRFRYLFIPTIIYLAASSLVNLTWSWF